MARASGIAKFTLVAQAQARNVHYLAGTLVYSCGLAIPEKQPKGFYRGLAKLDLLNRPGHINHKEQTYTSIFLTANSHQPRGPFYGHELNEFEWYCQVCYQTWNVERDADGQILPAEHWHPDQYRSTRIFRSLKSRREFAWAFQELVGKDRFTWSVVLSKKGRKKALETINDTLTGIAK